MKFDTVCTLSIIACSISAATCISLGYKWAALALLVSVICLLLSKAVMDNSRRVEEYEERTGRKL